MDKGKILRPGRLGLALNRWSDEENQFLKTHYLSMSLESLEYHLPGRTGNAIKQQAGVLNLWGRKQLEKPPRWSDEEMGVLRDYYPDNGLHVCCAFLPSRGETSISLKVKRMGLKRRGLKPFPKRLPKGIWEFVLSNVEQLGFVECAERTGDTPDNLRDKCSRRGIDCDAIDLAFNGQDFHEGPFSDDEIAYIRRYFPVEGGVRVGLALGRPPKKVINYAKRRLELSTQSPPRNLREPPPAFTVIKEVS
ncbi:MAG: hypothetical protein SWN10_23695 [Pseudomonadota bacterium]|nr:hypothetical protein [Pseudomonadota bacterium]